MMFGRSFSCPDRSVVEQHHKQVSPRNRLNRMCLSFASRGGAEVAEGSLTGFQ